MFRSILQTWRSARSKISQDSLKSTKRFLSDEAKGAAKTGGDKDSVREKLFQNVTLPGEEGAAAEFARVEEQAAGSQHEASGPVGRLFSILGNTIFYGGLGATAFFGYYQYNYTTAQLEHMIEETYKEENRFPGSSIWIALMNKYVDYRRYMESEMKKYADPPSDRLLPDLPPHARHIKTLVMDLDDVLIHSDWTRGRGWRTFKRPGADEFIKDMAQYFELVLYTSQLPTYADPILDRLDPHRMIQYRLYRDSTSYIDGKHVRDLSKLNRDLKQVLMITADPDAYSLQPENAIKLTKWNSKEKEDTTLLDLLPFLEAIVRTNVSDVRDVVKSYEGEDIPTAFRQRMERVREAKAKSSNRTSFFRK